MISIAELLTADALLRYDDDGEPAYTPPERVLIALRWFDWVTTERLFEAMDVWDRRGRARLQGAILHHVAYGVVAQRYTDRGVLEIRLVPPSQRPTVLARCRRCKRPPVEGRVLCAGHLEWSRQRDRRRRSA